MRTVLSGDIPSRQRAVHLRLNLPVALTPAIGTLPITAREVSPACLPSISGRAGLVLLDLSLPHHLSAAVSDSMSQRPSFVLQPTCVRSSAVLPLVLVPNNNPGPNL